MSMASQAGPGGVGEQVTQGVIARVSACLGRATRVRPVKPQVVCVSDPN